jgi:hypothetical protein
MLTSRLYVSTRLNSFLSPTEAAGATLTAGFPAVAPNTSIPDPSCSTNNFDNAAFFGLPLGADMEDW